MAKKKKKKKVKKSASSKKVSAGRPPLDDELRRDHSLRFRTTGAETDLMELASRYCDYKQRSRWAMSRLLMLARSVVKSKGIDPNNPRAVTKALKLTDKGLK